jgi:hypothetical protein
VDDAPEIAVLQLPKFKAEATPLIGSDGIEALAVYLIHHPDAGDVIPASGGQGNYDGQRRAKGNAAASGLSTCTLLLPLAFT